MFESLIDYTLERIEAKGRAIARRGDALFGCDDYEDASFEDRVCGMLGVHDDTWAERKAKSRTGAAAGDVIGVSRGLYKHYGIYTNKHTVIHYTSDESDLGGVVQETTLARFLRKKKKYFVLVFPETYGVPREAPLSAGSLTTPNLMRWMRQIKKSAEYHLYTPAQTLRRARSRLGEANYNLMNNNCEHFAIWCKTGINESHQVNSLVEALAGCNTAVRV